jgi:hypothetical protein
MFVTPDFAAGRDGYAFAPQLKLWKRREITG